MSAPAPGTGNGLYWTGLIGFVITAICCFSPVLVMMLTTLGMAGLVGLLDIVLFPLLAVFLVMFVVGYRRRKAARVMNRP